MRIVFRSRHALLLGLASLALLSGCRNTPGCARPTLYAQAEQMPPLRIPAGLEAPDTRGALRIPELNEPEAPLPAGVRCLDEPPKYAPNARLEPPPRERGRRGEKPAQPQPAAPPAPAAPAGDSRR